MELSKVHSWPLTSPPLLLIYDPPYPRIDRSIDLSNAQFQRFEEFKKLYERATNDLENLHVLLLDNKAIRADETEQALRTCARLNGDVKVSLDATLTNGEFF